jgi:hypothetical protein
MRYLTLLGSIVVVLCGVQARAEEQAQAPEDLSFGIGVGFDFPADLGQPNITVASFRYKNMQLQPFIALSDTKADEEMDDGVLTSKDEAKQDVRMLGAAFKYAFARRNKMDLQFITSLSYGRSSESLRPEGPANDSKTQTKVLDLSYGLGVEWWFASHFSMMATATNPIYTKSEIRTTQEQITGIEAFTETEDRSYGLVWDPSVSFAIMTWF